MTLQDLERLASTYATERSLLALQLEHLEQELREKKREALPFIKEHLKSAAEAKDKLHQAIEKNRHLFEQPKTRVIAGVRLGFRKQKGRIECDDEHQVIARIRRLLPDEQAELLIRVRESLDKQAVSDLSTSDLKRLGIRITDDEDAILIKPADADVDKLLDQLLADDDLDEAAA